MSVCSRRRFLQYAGLAAQAAVASACAGAPAPTATPPPAAAEVLTPTPAPTAAPTEAPTAAPAKYGEAPALSELVKAGKLPPVEERLPKEPLVVPVVEEIGQYGGTWHRCAVGPGDAGIINSRLSYECLFRWSQDGKSVVPNVAKGYEVSADATEFTIYLREGMRWSDGEPFTADDLLFYFQDVLGNTDLTPTYPRWLKDPQQDQPVTVEKVDDYTVKFKFASPYGLFIQMLAGPSALGLTDYPAHYLKQFHPNYTDKDELAKKTKDAGFDNWWELFGNKHSWQNPEHPHIWAWLPVRVPPDVPVVCERNPYYWKVDPAGNQLPYIDRIQFDVVENADLLNLKAVAGEIDMQFRHILWTNYPLFIENAEKGNYRVLKWTLAEGSNCTIMLNHNHLDPALRKLIETKEFRIALSLGIKRGDINELAYMGFGEPRQAALVPQCPYFKEEHAKRWAEHDPEQANKLLDELGLEGRDSEGFRLRPDGQQLSLTIEYAPIFGPWRDVVQMVCDQWKEIGIRGIPKEEDRTLFVQRGQAKERDAGIWTLDRCFTPLIEPYWWLPYSGGYAWAEDYATWYATKGQQGQEPPAELKRLHDVYDKIRATPSDEERESLAMEMFDIFSENIWIIGTVGVLPHVGVVKNNFRNVPEEAISDWLQLTPGNTNVEQYFIKQT